MKIEKENKTIGPESQPIKKTQLYALLVNSSGQPELDGNGNHQVVAIQSTDGSIKISSSGNLPSQKTVTIPAGQKISNVIDLTGETLEAIVIPNEWSNAQISFAVSYDNIDFRPLYYQGEELSFQPIINTQEALDPIPFLAVRYLKIRSGLSNTEIVQERERVLILLTKPI